MLDYFVTIDRAAIQNMTSASPEKIFLPYANTGDVCYNAGEMILDYLWKTGTYSDASEDGERLSNDHFDMLDRSAITAYLVLQPSRIHPRAGLVIDVDAPDGQRLHRSIYAPSGSNAAAEIISAFLEAGAPGLSADVRRSYERQHREFVCR